MQQQPGIRGEVPKQGNAMYAKGTNKPEAKQPGPGPGQLEKGGEWHVGVTFGQFDDFDDDFFTS